MRLSFFDILRFIIKQKILIIISVVISFAAVNFYVSSNQTYSAKMVFKYIGSSASTGFTPIGTKINPNEILSANVISEAIEDLGLKVGIESIRKKCSVTAIIPDDVTNLKEAKTKNGDEYTYFPTAYIVTYTASHDKSGAYARDVLDAIISNYIVYYSENYVSKYKLPDKTDDLSNDKYDYIEKYEIMDECISDHLQYLSDSGSSSSTFRSSKTGYSMQDLYDEYNIINSVDMPQIFSNLTNSIIAKNPENTLARYKNKNANAMLDYKNYHEKSDAALDLMHQFEQRNKDIPNSYNTGANGDSSVNATNNVVEDDRAVVDKQKTTYDQLVDNYVSSEVSAKDSVIDADFYQEIADSFNGPAADINASYETVRNINNVTKKLIDLEDIFEKTIEEYYASNATQYITILSSITMFENISKTFYSMVGLIAGGMLGVVLAIMVEIIKFLFKKQQHLGEE